MKIRISITSLCLLLASSLVCASQNPQNSTARPNRNLSKISKQPLPISLIPADTVSVYSPKMKREIKATVAIPSIPQKNKTESLRYPSIYIIHGFSDNYQRWGKALNLDSLATANQCIIICPDGQDSWYWDSPLDSTMQFETFISDELVRYIDQHYPTISNPKFRAITGHSMGGHGAMFLAMRHPDIFGNAGSMSGGLDIRPFPDRWRMKEWLGDKNQNLDRWTLHSAINQIDRIKNGDINIILDCGTSDFFLEVNRNFHKALLDAKINHDYIERPGGHTWTYWKNAIIYQLLFFRNNFNSALKTEEMQNLQKK